MGKTLNRRTFLGATLAAWPSVAYLKAAAASRAMGWKLGIITDEITEDFEQALDFISHYDLGYCELREMWKKNLMNLSQAELDRAKSLVEKHHLKVTDIGSPVFKYNLPEMPARKEKRDTFRADFTDQDSDHLLQMLQTCKIFWNAEGAYFQLLAC